MNQTVLGALDVFVVTWRPDLELLERAINALSSQNRHGFSSIHLWIWDNSSDSESLVHIEKLVEKCAAGFNSARVASDATNHGFGKGNNQLLPQSQAPWILLLNQDAVPEPDALNELGVAIESAPQNVAAWEMRQIPYEHPKLYDPSSLEVPWVSGAAVVLRRTAMVDVGGFDPSLFMYAEDVDLSWRLRAAGWTLTYLPRAAVFHDTYSRPGEEKPLQAVEGTLNNLLLRARFGSWLDISVGLLGVTRQILAPSSFPGRRAAFARLLPRFLRHVVSFRRSGKSFRGNFRPTFYGWNYSLHREGAFFPFRCRSEWTAMPLVSIVVRTHRRPAMLREALHSLIHQTYPNVEIIVVEDGEPTAQAMVETEFGSAPRLHYTATGTPVGRSHAGNIGLSLANGDWLGFLDDDDQLFADHVEVLLQTALDKKVLGAYGIAWEVVTKIRSIDPLDYEEESHFVRYRQAFSRPLMWHCNYLPIQSVLFHRSLYDRCGGFQEDMEQLEDWNLWTRYTLESEFVLVDKATSKYRVPADKDNLDSRQDRLDEAYQQAVERQSTMEVRINPRDFVAMVEDYNKGRMLISISNEQVKHALRAVGSLNFVRRTKRRLLARLRGSAT